MTHNKAKENPTDILPLGSDIAELAVGPYRLPNRASLLHKGGVPQYGAAGAVIPSRAHSPSSVTQLPILTALHAGSPTLFAISIHVLLQKVKKNFPVFLNFLFLRFVKGIWEVSHQGLFRGLSP